MSEDEQNAKEDVMFYSNRPSIKIYALKKRVRGRKVDYLSIKKKPINFSVEVPEKIDLIIPAPSSCTFPLRLANKLKFPIHKIKKKSSKKISQIPINLRGVVGKELFEIKGNFKNKTILLVDDISTTGATLNCIAEKLIEMGAERVIGLVYFLNK